MTVQSRASSVYSVGQQRQRKRPGSIVKYLQMTNCLLTLILFISSFERLEWFADEPLIDIHLYISYTIQNWCVLVDEYSQVLVYMGLLLHILSIKLSTKQAILSELLNYLVWPVLFALNVSPFTSNENRLVGKMILNALAFILSTCNLLIKRESIRTTKPGSRTSSSPPSIINSVTSNKSQKPPSEYNQWIDSDEDCSRNTGNNLEILPDPVRERTNESRECTPFTEISGRLSSLTLNFIRESTPTRLLFSPPKTQAPTMLTSAAITPSSKRIRSPFSSLKFHAISKQNMQVTQFDQPTWNPTSLPDKAPSLFSGSSTSGVSREYNLRYRVIPPKAPSTYSSVYTTRSNCLQSPAMRSIRSEGSGVSNGSSTSRKTKRNAFQTGFLFALLFLCCSIIVKLFFF